MPGMMKRVFSKTARQDHRREKQEAAKHKLSRSQRREIKGKLSAVSAGPRVKTYHKGRPKTERDFFHTARAEASRARRRRRNQWWELYGHAHREYPPSPQLVEARARNMKRAADARQNPHSKLYSGRHTKDTVDG